MTRMTTLITSVLLLTAMPLSAHHSFAAQYDPEQTMTVRGIVTKIEWMNPHVYFYMDVTDEVSGEVTNWGIEMGPPHQLQRRNWKRNSMAIGDTVVVEAMRARDGSMLANGRSVTLEKTGQVLGAASSESQTIGRE